MKKIKVCLSLFMLISFISILCLPMTVEASNIGERLYFEKLPENVSIYKTKMGYAIEEDSSISYINFVNDEIVIKDSNGQISKNFNKIVSDYKYGDIVKQIIKDGNLYNLLSRDPERAVFPSPWSVYDTVYGSKANDLSNFSYCLGIILLILDVSKITSFATATATFYYSRKMKDIWYILKYQVRNTSQINTQFKQVSQFYEDNLRTVLHSVDYGTPYDANY